MRRFSWLAALVMGCTHPIGPHDVDPNNPELMGSWKARDMGCLVGPAKKGYARLRFLDPSRVTLGDGRTVDYQRPEAGELLIMENDFSVDHPYNIREREIEFFVRDKDTGPERECYYDKQ